ncbi:MAG: RidA family protein [Salibacteraceae bacterium]|nr:RidA family protein [Salibacteraceae bacterium]|tara:strand:+ start:10021 stop:10401 length:381 start_codon:yes stop_codon:yes gene_type:complete
MTKVIFTENAPAPIGPYNQAIQHNDTVYVSGQIAINPATGNLEIDDLELETDLVLKNLGAVLNAAGMDYSNIIKCSIFLSDMGSFGTVNKIYGSYFTDNFPARETVEVACLPKNVNVEISCIAVAS